MRLTESVIRFVAALLLLCAAEQFGVAQDKSSLEPIRSS
mgnify:CR=1 FL=1